MIRLPAILGAAALALSATGTAPAPPPQFAQERDAMLKSQIQARGIRDARLLEAMRAIPREDFVPPDLRGLAYRDGPLPIGQGQTISQPYIVALMTEAARLRRKDRVLEIGTGSGYQAAVLGKLVREVYSIEIVPELGERARELLKKLGYRNIHVRVGDGYAGWPEKAPFQAILLTAAPEQIPQPLLDQLAVGGRLIAPVGPEGTDQELVRVTREKTDSGSVLKTERLLPVRFVPMTGKARGRSRGAGRWLARASPKPPPR